MDKLNEPQIDLNLDIGEWSQCPPPEFERELIANVSSVNIACGGHAGDYESMRYTVQLAQQLGVSIGAHPSYPDREGFGRSPIKISPSDLAQSLTKQIGDLARITNDQGAKLQHIKPHGALYNIAAQDQRTAKVLIDVVVSFDPLLYLVGLAGAPLAQWAMDAGLRYIHEGFADRRYEADGQLRSRKLLGALIEGPLAAAEQALSLAMGKGALDLEGNPVPLNVDTICIHGDQPNALETALQVRRRLEQAHIKIQSGYSSSLIW